MEEGTKKARARWKKELRRLGREGRKTDKDETKLSSSYAFI
jgi:hypothetical protein